MAVDKYLTASILDRGTVARLFSYIEIDRSTDCWNWTGTIVGGYGKVRFQHYVEGVHRVMFAWTVHPLPRGLGAGIPVVDHICNNKRCCNPAHLRMTDQRTNSIRAIGSQAWINSRKTHCKRGHLLPDPKPRSSGLGRNCVQCQVITNRERIQKDPNTLERNRAYQREYYRTKVKPFETPEQKARKRETAKRNYHAKHSAAARKGSSGQLALGEIAHPDPKAT